jgi:hypothetical protein
MTQPTETVADEITEETSAVLQPLDVRVVGEVEQAGKDYTSWSTYILGGTPADVAQRILPLDRRRDRAVIIVQPGTAGNTNGFVLIGSYRQVLNGQGAQLVNGNSIVMEGVQETWLQSDLAHSLAVTVIADRYA